MNALYLMCGNSFSGKSTLAAEMVRMLHFKLISLDAINEERGLGFGGDGIPVEERERTHAVAMERLSDLTRDGTDIILDDTNCHRWLRDRYRAVALKHGYRTVVIHLDIPLPVLRLRMRNARIHGHRPAVKEEIFDDLAARFENPGPDEATLPFRTSDTIGEWIRAHFPASNQRPIPENEKSGQDLHPGRTSNFRLT